MRVLFQGTAGGRVILNPPELIELVRNAPMKAAGIVLHMDQLIASTEPMTAHDVLIGMSGFEELAFTPGCGDPRDFTHRAGMNLQGLTMDVWMEEEAVEFPYTKESMDELLDYMENHRRLKKLPPEFELEVLVMDETGAPAFSYTREGLATVDHMAKREKPIDFPEATGLRHA